MKHVKRIIDLEIVPVVFVSLDGTAALSLLANTIHASV